MCTSPTLPTIDDLVDRAIAQTPFVQEITAAPLPLHIWIAAEIAAELAAEHWEQETSRPIGMTVPTPLINEVTATLVERSTALIRAAELKADVATAEARFVAVLQDAAQ